VTRNKTECEKTAEAVYRTIGQYMEHLMNGLLKGTVLGDLIRLLQMEEEMNMNQTRKITVGWANRREEPWSDG
jgi:hypothetical protein